MLPDANPMAFLAWLQAKLGQYTQPLNNIFYFGAYGAALAIAWSFQATRCDHLKKLGHANHNFPSVNDVPGTSKDHLCKNVVAHFLTKF